MRCGHQSSNQRPRNAVGTVPVPIHVTLCHVRLCTTYCRGIQVDSKKRRKRKLESIHYTLLSIKLSTWTSLAKTSDSTFTSLFQLNRRAQVSSPDFSSSSPSSGSRLRHTISRTARSPRRLSRREISCVHRTDLFPVVLMVELYAAWAYKLRLRAARSSVDTASGCVIRGGRGPRRY